MTTPGPPTSAESVGSPPTAKSSAAARWGFAMYLASKDGYEDAVLPTGAFAGLPEDALDCAAGLYLGDPTL